MESVQQGERKRTIKLFCPSISPNTVQITPRENQKLDLGSIARLFGLDPKSIKLNGHLISRGADLIASSVTWKSLIGFFGARGLSTGSSDSDALVVHGKLNRIGSKRSHDPEANENPEPYDQGCTRDNKKQQLHYCRLLNNDKLKKTNSGPVDASAGRNYSEINGLDLKRKLSLEDVIPFKRSRTDERVPGVCERSDGTSPTSRFTCSFISANTKRLRDNEMVSAAPLKRLK